MRDSIVFVPDPRPGKESDHVKVSNCILEQNIVFVSFVMYKVPQDVFRGQFRGTAPRDIAALRADFVNFESYIRKIS